MTSEILGTSSETRQELVLPNKDELANHIEKLKALLKNKSYEAYAKAESALETLKPLAWIGTATALFLWKHFPALEYTQHNDVEIMEILNPFTLMDILQTAGFNVEIAADYIIVIGFATYLGQTGIDYIMNRALMLTPPKSGEPPSEAELLFAKINK